MFMSCTILYRVRKLNPTVFKLAPTLLNIVFSVRSFAQLIVRVSVTAYTQYWPRTPSGMNSEEKVHHLRHARQQ